MSRRLVFVALVLGATACASPRLDIREVGAVHVPQKGETASGRVALGLSQLARGNVGLAVESFRRALREEPSSHQAMLGLAECYLVLGKPSLARRSLEHALALRPDIPELYRALAAAAEGEGRPQEAAELRREAQLRSLAPASPPAASSLTPVALVPAPLRPPAPAPAMPPRSITVDLTLDVLRDEGPRLVRLSMGEVALVTGDKSPFDVVDRRPDSTVHAPLRILNAARVQGIAAGTRRLLAAKGIRQAEIGDWVERKERSELRFGAADRARARAVAASLPFEVMLVERAGPIVLLVGRNAAP